MSYPSSRKGDGKNGISQIALIAEVLQIVELLRQAAEITVAVAAAVVKRAHVDLVNDRVLVPKPVLMSATLFPRIFCYAETLVAQAQLCGCFPQCGSRAQQTH